MRVCGGLRGWISGDGGRGRTVGRMRVWIRGTRVSVMDWVVLGLMMRRGIVVMVGGCCGCYHPEEIERQLRGFKRL